MLFSRRLILLKQQPENAAKSQITNLKSQINPNDSNSNIQTPEQRKWVSVIGLWDL
jgi:hypothetical protein